MEFKSQSPVGGQQGRGFGPLWKHLAPEDVSWETCILPPLGPQLSQEQAGSLRNCEPATLIAPTPTCPSSPLTWVGGGQAEGRAWTEVLTLQLHLQDFHQGVLRGHSGWKGSGVGVEVGLFNSTLNKNQGNVNYSKESIHGGLFELEGGGYTHPLAPPRTSQSPELSRN